MNEKTRVIALTGYDDADLIVRAMKVGAKGYILKTMAASQLVQSISEVTSGKIYLPPVLQQNSLIIFQCAFKDEGKII